MISDAHDPGKKHPPQMTTADLSLHYDPAYEKTSRHFLGNLKRSLSGTYHAFDFAKYAHRYLAEAQYRFNRRFDLRSILLSLLRAACLSIPAPARLIRAAEVGR